MVCYSHLFKNFPQFVVIHTVKGYGVVNEAEVDVFPEFSCFFYNPMDVDKLISGSSAFSKSSLDIWKLLIHILFKPRRILSMLLLACETSDFVWYFEHCLALPCFGIGTKIDLSSPVAIVELSTFAGILSAVLHSIIF